MRDKRKNFSFKVLKKKQFPGPKNSVRLPTQKQCSHYDPLSFTPSLWPAALFILSLYIMGLVKAFKAYIRFTIKTALIKTSNLTEGQLKDDNSHKPKPPV